MWLCCGSDVILMCLRFVCLVPLEGSGAKEEGLAQPKASKAGARAIPVPSRPQAATGNVSKQKQPPAIGAGSNSRQRLPHSIAAPATARSASASKSKQLQAPPPGGSTLASELAVPPAKVKMLSLLRDPRLQPSAPIRAAGTPPVACAPSSFKDGKFQAYIAHRRVQRASAASTARENALVNVAKTAPLAPTKVSSPDPACLPLKRTLMEAMAMAATRGHLTRLEPLTSATMAPGVWEPQVNHEFELGSHFVCSTTQFLSV